MKSEIWLEGSTIFVRFPESTGHTIFLPDTPAGLKALLVILRERGKAVRKIGYPSAPTQAQLTELLRSVSRPEPVKSTQAILDLL